MKAVKRTSRVPAYIFSRIDKLKKELHRKGVQVIDLGIGDPDLPTPGFITNTLRESVLKEEYHKYPPYRGIDGFKKAVAEYYKRRFNVDIDPEGEVAVLIGSKEGIAHLFLAITDPEDYVILPDPAYPVYHASAVISGCNVHKMKLYEKKGFLPDLREIPPEISSKAKLILVNYPNNPTGAEADEKFFEELVNYGLKNDIVVANDGAYIDIGYDGYRPVSILQVPGAKDIAVEFGSLSKPYNMTGWRIGYIVGNSEVIEKLMIIKTNFDSGQFGAIQEAGIEALQKGDNFIKEKNEIYFERRKKVSRSLRGLGLEVCETRTTFYVWFRVPEGFTSEDFASFVLQETGIIITPGSAYGDQGEGFCRISLTVPDKDIGEAMKKLGRLKFNE